MFAFPDFPDVEFMEDDDFARMSDMIHQNLLGRYQRNESLRVGFSTLLGAGIGAFATTRDFVEGEVIGIYRGTILSNEQAEALILLHAGLNWQDKGHPQTRP